MNNLKPNMYIRTKEGKIDKVLEINTEDFDEPVVRLASYPLGMYQGNFEYEKASHNIIDLIEIGDLIKVECEKDNTNVFEVVAINYNDNELGIFNNDFNIDFCSIEQINSIVTKEQFSQMEYRIGE